MTEPSLSEILDFALALNAEAGRFIMSRWKSVAVEHKPDGSEVTEADRGAEQLLRKRIAARYPDHAVLGEEFGGENQRNAEHLWLIDPVDGTASFAIGLPLFGTLIAYLRRGAACVGLIGAHALHETIYAARGQGCWHQREASQPKPVRTSGVANPAQAFVVSTSLEHTDMDARDPTPAVRLSRLYRQARRFRWSGDCINYTLLCQGLVDVAFDSRMHPWDIAAVTVCVREAGGVATSVNGNEDNIWQPNLLACATPELHTQVLQLLGSD
jgi:histidinol-phosphatase